MERDLERYSRQMRFYGMGESGQRKLAAAHVTLCGCGALGTVLANVLVRAGVGHLRLVDRDFIETSNLQRLEGPALERVREDMACLTAFARQEKWPKQLVRALQSFLSDYGIGTEKKD